MAAILAFNASVYGSPCHRDLISDVEGSQNSTLCDGTMVSVDKAGRLRQVHYANGVKVVRQAAYCLVQAPDRSFWYGDDSGGWYPLD
jgi:hypothetical protein